MQQVEHRRWKLRSRQKAALLMGHSAGWGGAAAEPELVALLAAAALAVAATREEVTRWSPSTSAAAT